MALHRMPTRLRVVHEVPPLSQFVILAPGASGDFGWLREAGALLIGRGEEKGEILLAAFMGRKPERFQGQYINVPALMLPEMAVAAAALKGGISLEGCGLYMREFPSSAESVVFFARAGIITFWYLYAKVIPNRDTVARLGSSGARIIRVDA